MAHSSERHSSVLLLVVPSTGIHYSPKSSKGILFRRLRFAPIVPDSCKSTLPCTSRPRHIWCHQSLQSNDVGTGRNKKSLNTASSQKHPVITVSHIVSTTLFHRLGRKRNYIQLQPNNSLYAWFSIYHPKAPKRLSLAFETAKLKPNA